MKEWIKKLLLKFKQFLTSSEAQAKKITTIAIKITNYVKMVLDSHVTPTVAEIVKIAIPGKADDIAIDAAIAKLPKVIDKIIAELIVVDGLLINPTMTDKANYILSKIKFSSDQQKNEFAHNLCTKLVQYLSDGKLSFGEAVILSEMVYQELKQNKQL